jgi:hypothetical protein
MKRKKLMNIIQIPLRFHHQDIHEELETLNLKIDNIELLLKEISEKIK